ncbi:hypothetical protein [Acetivibrio cellulolyticus]|uniref:hypothetical protein n=1 Tax=Acetivibrio cellulolyticus TaxID=35830 RepID=UPI0001E2D8E4|nr:hypothetical protein [Acetivibrio cellulolyticus]
MNELLHALEKEASAEKQLSKNQYERLMLITEALWEILKEEHNYSDEKLIEKLKIVDLKDGREDGRVLLPPSKCSSCNKTVEKGTDTCIYCGSPVKVDVFYR